MVNNQKEEVHFKGSPGAPGVVHGPLFSFYQGEVEVPRYSVPPERREEEIARFEQGLMQTRRQITAIRAEVEEKVGEEEAAIFDAHQLVLEDTSRNASVTSGMFPSGSSATCWAGITAPRRMKGWGSISSSPRT
jgi:phosphoenolpyruvate-protein kinase (PTS system EI component)